MQQLNLVTWWSSYYCFVDKIQQLYIHPEHLTGESSWLNPYKQYHLKTKKERAEVVNLRHNQNIRTFPKDLHFLGGWNNGKKWNKEGGRHISCLWNTLPGLHFLLRFKFLTKFEKTQHSTLRGINSIFKVFYLSKTQFWWNLVLCLY